MKTDSGFTVLEMMVVVLIVSVLLAVGIPRMSEMVKNNRLIAQTNELVVSLSLARAEALRRNTPVIMCRIADENAATPGCGAGTGWRDGWAIFVDADGNNAYTAGEFIVMMHGNLGTSTTLVMDNATFANQVRFSAMGTLGATGTYTLTDDRGAPNGQRLICVTITGRAAAC